jgi:hypothetical protein
MLAIGRTFGEINQHDTRFIPLFSDMISNAWKHELSIGINRVGSDFFDIDPRILAALNLFTFNNTLRRSDDGQMLDGKFTVQFAVTPVADILFYADSNLIALNMPQGFDYYITADPRRVADEWDMSMLGEYFGLTHGMILQDAFYDYYARIINFTPAEREDAPSWREHTTRLSENIEIEYLGKNPKGDAYSIIINIDDMNDFLTRSNPLGNIQTFPDDLIGDFVNEQMENIQNARLVGSIIIELYVASGKMSGLLIETQAELYGNIWDVRADAVFKGETANLDDISAIIQISNGDRSYDILIESKSRVGNADLTYSDFSLSVNNGLFDINWRLNWDRTLRQGDNFTFWMEARYGNDYSISLNTGGTVSIDSSHQYIDANLRRMEIDLNTDEGSFDANINLRYILRPDHDGFQILEGTKIPITLINEMDIISIYSNLTTDPRLGPLFGMIFN